MISLSRRFKTVVTGGAGFIGCHLVKRLLDEGRAVLVVDNFSRGSLENLRDVGAKNVQCVEAGLRDYCARIGLEHQGKLGRRLKAYIYVG